MVPAAWTQTWEGIATLRRPRHLAFETSSRMRMGLGGCSQRLGKGCLLSILSILILLGPGNSASAGVNTWTTNGPEGGWILALAVDPANRATLYAGNDWGISGTDGGIFKSTDAGRSWTAIHAGLEAGPVRVLAIDPSAPATLYAGASGGAFKSTNGGLSWTAINTGLSSLVSALVVDPSAPATLYAGTTGAGVFKSTNAGGSWTAINTGLPRWALLGISIEALAIDPSAPATLYTITLLDGVFRSTNAGASWTAINTGLPDGVSALAIDPAAPATLYAGTRSGVFKSTNAGGNWTAINTALNDPYVSVLAIAPSAPETLYVATVNFNVFKSTNAGESWTAINTGLTHRVNALAVDPSDSARVYAGTDGGVFDYEGIETCASDPTTLCLNDGRFRVQVNWSVPSQGRGGIGTAVPLTGDTGYFWFFNSDNVELVIKALDAVAVNGHYWVFYGALSNVQYTITVTDTATGAVKTYENPAGTMASVADTSAFTPQGASSDSSETASEQEIETRTAEELYSLYAALTEVPVKPKAAAIDPCTPGGTTLCLNQSRFQVSVDWEVPSQGRSGHGTAVPVTSDTGYFWFFNSSNVELVIKALDAVAVNGHYWVFYGALSNVHYTITVTDTETGMIQTYENPSGTLASVADTTAF
jgi:photosystem II stability/assembly factor-like uncharacterized protein